MAMAADFTHTLTSFAQTALEAPGAEGAQRTVSTVASPPALSQRASTVTDWDLETDEMAEDTQLAEDILNSPLNSDEAHDGGDGKGSLGGSGNQGRALLTLRAELLRTAQARLNIGANVGQSLRHIFDLVAQNRVRSRQVFDWIEDWLWELAILGSPGDLEIFHDIYGDAVHSPLLPRPQSLIGEHWPALQGLDLQPNTFVVQVPPPPFPL